MTVRLRTVAVSLALVACAPAPPARDLVPASAAESSPASAPSHRESAPEARAHAAIAETPEPEKLTCAAPSLVVRGAADAREPPDLEDCRFAPSGDDDIGDRCGTPAFPAAIDLDRLDAALVLDAEALDHVARVAARGRALGRRPNVFALVGDSITASPKFLRPFARGRSPKLAPEVEARLRLDDGALVIDAFQPADLDPFSAPRAAQVGALASFAVPENVAVSASPLGLTVARLSPSVAFVMFGSNDATVRFAELESLEATFRARLERIVDALLEAGVVPVLHTVVRHMKDAGQPDCDHRPGDLSNWRIAVQTSALSAVAASVACERHLPLVDLRHAFDALRNHGIGLDGVHPNAHRRGAGALDAEALGCGYNTRNYVTLRMLTLLHPRLR